MSVYFYGLFMDPEVLAGRGAAASSPRRARLDGFRLAIGERATLLRAAGSTVHGVVMDMAADQLERLYSAPDVALYVPIAVTVVAEDGRPVAATCYVLPEHLPTAQANPAYAEKLRALGRRLGLPDEYLRTI